jgi:hypothetical protein
MATLYWRGDAEEIAQISSGSVDSVDGTPANNNFTVTIGNATVTVAGDTDVATTAAALQTALAASTHPYFVAVTWTNPSGGTITGTAAVAGVPFVAALSVSGAGTGTVTDFSTSTVSAGPADWSTGDNWVNAATGATGIIPASTDTVIIENTDVNIVYGLDQNAIALDELRIEQSYTGEIGMSRIVFATSADGNTTDATKIEYRDHYLKIGAEVIEIGRVQGPGLAVGSTRIKINNVDAAASTTTIHNTASSSDGIFPAVRLLNTHASSTLSIRSAPGGVGVAVDEPGETTTFSAITMTDDASSAQLFTGAGLTLTTFTQNAGTALLRTVDAGTVTTATLNGGTLTMEGDYTVTTLNINGGTCEANHKESGTAVTTANLDGGTTSTRGSSVARTWATVNLGSGATFIGDSSVTITTLNEPSDPYSITLA